MENNMIYGELFIVDLHNIGDLHVLWESSPLVSIEIHQVILSSKGLALAVDDLLGPLDVFTILNDS